MLTRFQAATIAGAQGQAAAILRKRRRLLRTGGRRRAGCGSAGFSAQPGQGAVQGEQAEPGQQGRGGQRGGRQALFIASELDGYLPMPQSFPVADGVLDPGMDPVRGVEVGVLPQPALRDGEPVRHPQGVPPAVVRRMNISRSSTMSGTFSMTTAGGLARFITSRYDCQRSRRSRPGSGWPCGHGAGSCSGRRREGLAGRPRPGVPHQQPLPALNLSHAIRITQVPVRARPPK